MNLNGQPELSPEILKTFETLPSMYLIMSKDLVILTASNLYLQATGKIREEISGKYLFDIFPIDEDVEASVAIRTSLAEVILNKTPVQLPISRYDLPDRENEGGTKAHYWHSLNTPVLSTSGDILYIIHSTRELTSQVIAENELKISLDKQTKDAARSAQLSKRIEKLFADLPARIAILSGPQLVYEFINPIYHQHFGERELIGKPFLEALPELAGHQIVNELNKVYETGVSFEGKEICIPIALVEGGQPVDHYFNIMYQARLDENGKVNGILSFAYDITELVYARKKLEGHEQQLLGMNQDLAQANEEIQSSLEELTATNEDLSNMHERLQLLNTSLEQRVEERTTELKAAQQESIAQRDRLKRFFMQSPAGICILDGPEFVFELVNPVYQQLFPGRDLTGKTLLEALPELKGQAIPGILEEVYRSGNTFEGTGLHVPLARTKDGPIEDRYFNFIYQARQGADENVDGILVFAFEVTVMILAEQQMEAEQLKKDEFLSIASHELKTPLTSVKAFNQLMQRTDNIDKLKSFISKSADNILRLDKLIGDLLDVTKINAGKMQYNMQLFSFDDMLKQVVENVQHTAPNHEIVLAQNVPIQYNGDKIRIEQVINNFLTNAIKYSPAATQIIVKNVLEDGRIIVSVQDFGIGIAAKDMDHLFERYYRINNGSMQFEGLGLGLFISSEILRRHQGSFWIESEPGAGSTFFFMLPITET